MYLTRNLPWSEQKTDIWWYRNVCIIFISCIRNNICYSRKGIIFAHRNFSSPKWPTISIKSQGIYMMSLTESLQRIQKFFMTLLRSPMIKDKEIVLKPQSLFSIYSIFWSPVLLSLKCISEHIIFLYLNVEQSYSSYF